MDSTINNRVKKRVLWGCGCGCLLPLFIMTVLVVFGIRYVQAPGDQIPTRNLLTESTEGFIQLTPENGRPELALWLGELLEALGKLDAEAFSGADQADLKQMIESLRGTSAESGKDFFDFSPSSFTVALAPDPESADQLALVSGFNLVVAGKFAHFLFGWWASDQPDTIEYEDTSIVPLRDATEPDTYWYLSFAKDTPVISSSLPLMKSTLTSLLHPEETPAEPSEGTLRLRSDWNDLNANVLLSATLGYHERLSAGLVRGWFDLLSEMLDSNFQTQASSWPSVSLDHMRLELDLDRDDATARLELFGVAPEDMAACEAFVDEWMAGIKAQLQSEGIDVATDRLSGPGNLVLDLRLNHFKDWIITRAVDAVQAQSETSSGTLGQ